MCKTATPPLVPLEELAAVMGGATVETAAARLPARTKPVEDWVGRLCVPSELAARVVSAYQRELASAQEKQRVYEAYVEEREKRRQEAGELGQLAARHNRTRGPSSIVDTPRSRSPTSRAEPVAVLFARPVVYNRPTTIHLGGGHSFRELVAPGALTTVLSSPAARNVVFLRDHDPGRLLARVGAGTLKLEDTRTALDAEVTLPDTELGRDTRELVGRGDLAGGSFPFTVARETWYEDRAGEPVRVIEEVGSLHDVCACTFPAYEATTLWLGGEGRAAPGDWRAGLTARRAELAAKVNPRSGKGPWWSAPAWAAASLRRCGGNRVGASTATGAATPATSSPSPDHATAQRGVNLYSLRAGTPFARQISLPRERDR